MVDYLFNKLKLTKVESHFSHQIRQTANSLWDQVLWWSSKAWLQGRMASPSGMVNPWSCLNDLDFPNLTCPCGWPLDAYVESHFNHMIQFASTLFSRVHLTDLNSVLSTRKIQFWVLLWSSNLFFKTDFEVIFAHNSKFSASFESIFASIPVLINKQVNASFLTSR